jgi:hypothetical protein
VVVIFQFIFTPLFYPAMIKAKNWYAAEVSDPPTSWGQATTIPVTQISNRKSQILNK